MRTKTTFAALFAAVLALPAAAQETPPDTTTYRGAAMPVWVAVEDVEHEAGAHRVRAAVVWDDYRSTLRFATEILPGELVVTIPKSEDPASAETCSYTSALMAHGSEGYQPFERADTDCLAPPVEHLAWIEVEHLGAPLACVRALRNDGKEDAPTQRLYGCYWAQPPDEG
ncbi:MAG: hypothetical protein F4X13_03430 [Gammaproteobacteria bacterium]|nr:hypothetical protein [Gammaproteobacteria bacterium]